MAPSVNASITKKIAVGSVQAIHAMCSIDAPYTRPSAKPRAM
jgi:hypothetical protein